MAKQKKDKKKKSAKKLVYAQRRILGAREEINQSLENIALLIDSGVSIDATLGSIISEVKNKRLKKVFAHMKADVSNGMNLSDAFEQSRLLPAHLLSLLRSGEQSGRMSENLGVIIRQQERDAGFRAKLKAAMFYPVIVIGLAVVVGFGIAWFILPKLADAFGQLGADLPATTRILINLGDFFAEHGIILFLVFTALTLILMLAAVLSPGFRAGLVLLATKFPGVHTLVNQIELARFGFIAGGMIESGISVVETFRSLERSSTLPKYRKMYGLIAGRIEQGESFRIIFEQNKKKITLPRSIQQMMLAGEQAGSLSRMLQSVGARYEQKIDNTSKNLSAILEPILLVVVALVVAFIAISIILPIYSLIGNLG